MKLSTLSLSLVLALTLSGSAQALSTEEIPNDLISADKLEQLKARLQGPLPSLKAARSDVPDWLEGVFHKMLAQKPQDRYQTVAEAVHALQPAMTPGGAAGPDGHAFRAGGGGGYGGIG